MDELEEYNCCVADCDSNQISNPELYFHTLPNDYPTRELWLNVCKISTRNKEVLKSFKICEKHFDKSQYLTNYQLLPGCVPNLCSNTISVINSANLRTLNNEIRQCIQDENIKKFNVSSGNKKLTHLLVVLNEFKSKIDENIQPIDENPPDLNTEPLETINLSTFPIPDVISETVDGSNTLVINKFTETGDEIKMTIKSSKRVSITEKAPPKPVTYDFTRICRICLENGVLKNIYAEKVDDIVVDELLKRYTSFMMLETSNLPQEICAKCVDNLKQTHNLFKKIDQSGTIFQNRLRLYPLDQSDMLSYAQKYFPFNETPIVQLEPQLEPQLDPQPDIQEIDDTDLEVIQEENEALVDLEPDRTIEQIMDIDGIEANTDEFKCLKCDESYENHLLLSKHMCTFTPESADFLSEYSCNFCKTSFTTYNKFSTHLCYLKTTKNELTSSEQKKEFSCQVCHEVFPSNSLYLYHRKLYKHNISFYCYECNVNFVTRNAFRRHNRTYQHSNEKKCEYCEQFIKISKFKAHMLEHDCLFACTMCNAKYASKRKCEQHILSHNKRREVRKTFPTKNRAQTVFPTNFTQDYITNKSLPFPGRIISNINTPLGSKLHSLLIQNNSENITEPIEDLLRTHFPGRVINNSLTNKNKYKLHVVKMYNTTK